MNEPFHFRPTPTKRALTFLGFCPAHDHDLFRPVEHPETDLLHAGAHVLFSYRALIGELRKKENNVRWYEKIFADGQLSMGAWLNLARRMFELRHISEQVALKTMTSAKEAFEHFLTNGQWAEPFAFSSQCFQVPLEVLTSAAWSRPVAIDVESAAAVIDGRLPAPVVPTNFATLIPRDGSTTIILAHLGPGKPNFPEKNILVPYLNDLLLKRIETWACSWRWFQEQVAPREEAVLHEMRRLLPPQAKNLPVAIDLFSAPPEDPRPVAARRPSAPMRRAWPRPSD